MNTLRSLLESSPEIRSNVQRRLFQMLGSAFFMGLGFFGFAGTLAWAHAWVYLALFLGSTLIGALILPWTLIAERGSRKKDIEVWDRTITRVLLAVLVALLAVCGLDRRFGWTPTLPLFVYVFALTLFAMGSVLQIWAMWSNPFFSTTVRLQFDRGHTVVFSGPYRMIRHPGYLAMILIYLASPLLLDSLWGLIPGIAMGLLFILRTHLEDQTLMQKLPGYTDYSNKVKTRLFPGLW